MSERSKMISKMIGSISLRESYIRSKLSVMLPSQIRSLRQSRKLTQGQLGEKAEMKQGRISMMERIGEGKFTIETLTRIAAALGVGLIVKFVPFSEMLAWENEFEPDNFDVLPIDEDVKFISPEMSGTQDSLPQYLQSILGAGSESNGQCPVSAPAIVSSPSLADALFGNGRSGNQVDGQWESTMGSSQKERGWVPPSGDQGRSSWNSLGMGVAI